MSESNNPFAVECEDFLPFVDGSGAKASVILRVHPNGPKILIDPIIVTRLGDLDDSPHMREYHKLKIDTPFDLACMTEDDRRLLHDAIYEAFCEYMGKDDDELKCWRVI